MEESGSVQHDSDVAAGREVAGGSCEQYYEEIKVSA